MTTQYQPVRRIVVRLFSVLGFALCALLAEAGEPSGSLKVVSYNVQFLPGWASIVAERPEPEYRARRIGQELSAFDIVGLNEVFETKPRELLLAQLEKAWQEDYQVVISPNPPKRINGGLAIATRWPITQRNSMAYSQASSPAQYGLKADGFAAKGALHARIVHTADGHARELDVFVTHMESKDDAIRETQYVELADFVRQHSDARRAVLILGDFNTHGDPQEQRDPDAQYQHLMKALGKARADALLVDLWPHLEGDKLGGTNRQETTEEGHRIDYIFYSNPARGANALEPISIRVNPFLDRRVFALSDHSAVEGVFRWKSP